MHTILVGIDPNDFVNTPHTCPWDSWNNVPSSAPQCVLGSAIWLMIMFYYAKLNVVHFWRIGQAKYRSDSLRSSRAVVWCKTRWLFVLLMIASARWIKTWRGRTSSCLSLQSSLKKTLCAKWVKEYSRIVRNVGAFICMNEILLKLCMLLIKRLS